MDGNFGGYKKIPLTNSGKCQSWVDRYRGASNTAFDDKKCAGAP